MARVALHRRLRPGAARRSSRSTRSDGPQLVFADGTESIFLADMSGDGLTDLVRIRAGEVCYWPNLGYGRFGTKVTMDGVPRLDRQETFDARRVRLADIDGSGTSDIVYFASGEVHLYFSQSGNSFAQRRVLSHFPLIDTASIGRRARSARQRHGLPGVVLAADVQCPRSRCVTST